GFARGRAACGRHFRRARLRAGQADRLRLPAAGLRYHPHRGRGRAVPVLLPQEGAHRGVVLGAAAERRDLELPDDQVGACMSVRRLAEPHLQPKEFAFTAENLEWAKGQIAKYPEGRHASAVIPLLWRAQEQAGGWVPEAAIRFVADLLGMAHIR